MAKRKTKEVSLLDRILREDVRLTKWFVEFIGRRMDLRACRKYFRALEFSCHGVPWITFWLAITWITNNLSLAEMQVNMLFGLFLDLVIVGPLKAITRRKRPPTNQADAIAEFGPDKFSFPSGHASRATYVAYFFTSLYPAAELLHPFLALWALAVCLSRVLMNRHHVLDVLNGVFAGLVTGYLVGVFRVNDSTARWLVRWISR